MSASAAASARAVRVLVLTPDFPPARGGIQALMGGLVAAMENVSSRVVTLDSPGSREFDASWGGAIHRVRSPARLGSARNLPLNAAALVQARSFRPDVLLSAHIVTSPAAAVLRRTLGVPGALYFHANEVLGKPRLAAWAARHADISIAVSSYTEGLLREVGAPTGSLLRIPPGVDLPERAGAERSARPTVLTVSRLNDSYKGHDVLLEALVAVRERVPDVEWVVLGDGPLRPALQAQAQRAGLGSSTRFLGGVDDAERDAWLDRAHVFAMPSRLPGGGLAGEGFGIVFLEAGAHGTPVVAGNVGGAVDAVDDGETGLLVDPADPRAVAAAVTSLLLDPDRARRMGAAARERARTFAWPVIAARVERALLELAETGRARPSS